MAEEEAKKMKGDEQQMCPNCENFLHGNVEKISYRKYGMGVLYRCKTCGCPLIWYGDRWIRDPNLSSQW
jgi:hypothetical protein